MYSGSAQGVVERVINVCYYYYYYYYIGVIFLRTTRDPVIKPRQMGIVTIQGTRQERLTEVAGQCNLQKTEQLGKGTNC